MDDSYIDLWKKSYEGRPDIKMFGSSMTYEMAAEFLDDCDIVEDWGCGRGGFTLFRKKPIIGVDGTSTPFVHKIADLREYTSNVDGILLRHVLEHNRNWDKVLVNAINSFRKKLCVVLFVPLSEDGTKEVSKIEDPDIPTLSLDKDGFLGHLNCGLVDYTYVGRLHTDSTFRNEHVYLITRKPGLPGPGDPGFGT